MPTQITPFTVYQHAPLTEQLVAIVLIALIAAAIAVLATKLMSGGQLAGGSAFLSGLRLGAPIIGVLGACHAGLYMTLAVASVPFEPTRKMFAPGVAQSFMMVGLGLLAGVVGIVAHWIVESRIDRQVLGV